jgi:SPP1 gp7 family putative phage head morphogenesis protein
MISLPKRLRSAFHLVLKGWTPFDRPFADSDTGAPSLTQPYVNSAWVRRAIATVAQSIAGLPLCHYTDDSTELEDTPVNEFWADPCAHMDPGQFWIATASWIKLSGESFWLLDDTWLTPLRATLPSKLIIARPDRMREIIRAGQLVGWQYTDGAGQTANLLPEQVAQIKLWSPYSDTRGAPEYTAAHIAAESDYLAANFLRNVYRNNGDQGPYIASKAPLTEEQQRQIEATLRQKRALASKGQFKAAFFSGDITVEDPKVTSPDAAFASNRLQSRHEIAIAFGVPPSMFDIKASYSIGSASDYYALITQTCQPLGSLIASTVTSLNPRLGIEATSEFDWDEHPVMQAVRNERMTSAVQLWDRGMSWKDISDYLDLGLKPFPGWDQAYLPFSATPLDSTPPTASTDYAEPDDTEDAEDSDDTEPSQQRWGRSRCERPLDQIKSALAARAASPTTWQRNRAAEVAQWRTHMAARRGSVKAYEARFKRHLMEARRQTLANLAKGGAARAASGESDIGGAARAASGDPQASSCQLPTPTPRAAAADFVFDLLTWKTDFLAGMRAVAATALQSAGQQLFKEIERDDPFTMPDPRAVAFFSNRENKLSGIADDVHRQVMDTLADGISEGLSIEHLADQVRATFNSIDQERARRIAMTETAAAYGVARQEAMTQSSIPYKQWLTSGNDNVREDHRNANGQIAPVHEDFIVGDEALAYPGDPKGSPANIINCHCVAIPTREAPQLEV